MSNILVDIGHRNLLFRHSLLFIPCLSDLFKLSKHDSAISATDSLFMSGYDQQNLGLKKFFQLNWLVKTKGNEELIKNFKK